MVKLDPKQHEVVEGSAGYWHYHLRNRRDAGIGNPTGAAFCGEWRVMSSSITVDKWQVPFGAHFGKRPTWCKECERLRASA
jgi:hypothetical protein